MFFVKTQTTPTQTDTTILFILSNASNEGKRIFVFSQHKIEQCFLFARRIKKNIFSKSIRATDLILFLKTFPIVTFEFINM
jgi:hypothetical protein